jgi:hypothetical protein
MGFVVEVRYSPHCELPAALLDLSNTGDAPPSLEVETHLLVRPLAGRGEALPERGRGRLGDALPREAHEAREGIRDEVGGGGVNGACAIR